MADTDVSIAINNALLGQNSIGGDQIVDDPFNRSAPKTILRAAGPPTPEVR